MFVFTIECYEYDVIPQCDKAVYGDKCNTMDPFAVVRTECKSKILPNLVLYYK